MGVLHKCSVASRANMQACGADPANLLKSVFSPKTIIIGKYRLFLGKKEDFFKNLEKWRFWGKNGILKDFPEQNSSEKLA
jgi:hypothetical protein